MIYLKEYGLIKGADDICDDCIVAESDCPMLGYAQVGVPFEVHSCDKKINMPSVVGEAGSPF